MFHSFAEQVFFILTIASVVTHLIYVQVIKRSAHPIAVLCNHRRTQHYATQFLRLGMKGAFITGVFTIFFCSVILLQLEWYALTVVVFVVNVSTLIMILRKYSSLTEADLAEAKVFMDYDLQMPSIRSYSVKRPR